MASYLRSLSTVSKVARGLHTTASRHAVTPFTMPAMSPTMTEGGIASWKKKEGEAFTVGDILLEIETDKATMDVEAQDDGVMGKIVVQDGAKGVPVGKIIALLAEEGDDISNLQVPAEAEASSPPQSEANTPPKPAETPAPSPPSSSATPSASTSPKDAHTGGHPHSKLPIFPSVLTLIKDHNLSADVDSLGIKGTGRRGMLTRGDVLTYLGLASGPNGTYKLPPLDVKEVKPGGAGAVKKEAPYEPPSGDALRRLIVAGLAKSVQPAPIPMSNASFDSVIQDYVKSSPKSTQGSLPLPSPSKPSGPAGGFLDGLY